MTDWLFVYLTDWSIDRLIDWLIDWSIDWLVDWLFVWLTDWLIDWLIDWLVDWLIDWLSDCCPILAPRCIHALTTLYVPQYMKTTPLKETMQPSYVRAPTSSRAADTFRRQIATLLVLIYGYTAATRAEGQLVCGCTCYLLIKWMKLNTFWTRSIVLHDPVNSVTSKHRRYTLWHNIVCQKCQLLAVIYWIGCISHQFAALSIGSTQIHLCIHR